MGRPNNSKLQDDLDNQDGLLPLHSGYQWNHTKVSTQFKSTDKVAKNPPMAASGVYLAIQKCQYKSIKKKYEVYSD
mgnify:CR=1 FL=1